MIYAPTEWSTAADKLKFANHFKRFVQSGYKRNLFHKWFYTRLSMCFGFIAHYDIDGFYAFYFDSEVGRLQFERHVRYSICCGSAAYTYADVERDLQEWLNEIRHAVAR